MDEDVSLPLEDEDGYVQCGRHNKSNLARKLSGSPPSLREIVFVTPPRPEQRSPDPTSQQRADMSSRKRSKTLERLSVLSISRPSPPAASRGTADPRRRRQLQAPAVPPPPRVPPRPNEQLLNRFHLQRANFSPPAPSSGLQQPATSSAPRRKYVEVDVIEKGETPAGARGSPRLRRTKAALPRTSYVVLQIDGPTRSAPCSPSSASRAGRLAASGKRVQVKRCKSSTSERSLRPARDPFHQPRHSAAFPAHQHQLQTPSESSRRLQEPQSVCPPRKPRKSSVPNPLPSSYHTTPRPNLLHTRAVSVTTDAHSNHHEFSQTSSSESNLFPDPVEPDETIQPTSSLHIINLRSGTATFEGGSNNTPSTVGPTSDSTQVHRPPPPLRKPPSRPPAPTPRARRQAVKTTAKTETPSTELEPYVHMSPSAPLSNPAAIASGSPGQQRKITNNGCGAKNTTPLPRESWGHPPGLVGAGKGRPPTPDSGSEEFGAYSYVDLVRDRHLFRDPSLTGAPPTPPVAPGNTSEFLIRCSLHAP